jgi:hypothetical protein
VIDGMRWVWLIQTMILVHTVDERAIALNMEQIVSLTHPSNEVTDKAKCLLSFGGGRFVNTKETCQEVGVLWQHEDAKIK